MQEMSFIISKRTILMAILIVFCLGCTVNACEIEEFTEEQKQELKAVFVEKVEYVCNYDLWTIGQGEYWSEGKYRKKALPIFLYWKKGMYYFIPVVDCNAEAEIDGVSRQVKRNEYQKERYCFCALIPPKGTARDRGRWYSEYYSSMRVTDMDGLNYLGVVEIDTSGEEKPEIEKLSKNGYIRALVDHMENSDWLPSGDYQLYIGWYGYLEPNRVSITGVIRRDETYRYFIGEAFRNRDGSYEGMVYPTNGGSEWLPTIEEMPSSYDSAMRIVEAERLVVDLHITGQGRGQVIAGQEKQDETRPRTAAIEITAKEAREDIEGIYNYYNWFYGSVPYDIGLLLEEGYTYCLYTDGAGNIFWRKNCDVPTNEGKERYGGIYKSELQADIEKLPLYSYTMDNSYQSELHEIGSMNWQEPKLRKPKLPPMVEDGYIREVKEYIKDDLTEKGKKGNYELYFGRYEILASDIRSISVAVTGEETFYLQFWITYDPDGNYDCFPVGGSHMGEQTIGLKKIDRIVQLDRLKMELEIK